MVFIDGVSKPIKLKSANDFEFDGWTDDTQGGLITPVSTMEEVSFSCDVDTSFKEIYGKQVENEVACVITSDFRINRPKNLKYPNRKRAHRVLNKWRKRYGVEYGKALVIPRAKLGVSVDGATINITIHAQDIHKEG